MTTELTCPKCQATMRSYERNGIHIDQCIECRGVFLDRGELELLMDAEAVYSQAAQQGRAAPSNPRRPIPGPPPQATQSPGYGWDQGGGHHSNSASGGHHGKRKKGFLGELFD